MNCFVQNIINQLKIIMKKKKFVSQVNYKLDNEYYYMKNYVDNIWKYEKKYQ